MASSIELGQIERRLGPIQSPVGGSTPEPVQVPESEGISGIFSVGTMLLLATTFIVVSLVTYLLPDIRTLTLFQAPVLSSSFESQANSLCQKYWKEGRYNDVALSCYLTNSVSRFCDPGEREHLVGVLKDYRRDARKADGGFLSLGGDETEEKKSSRKVSAMRRKMAAQHTKEIRLLVERGYLTRSDFGWFADPLVKKVFARPIKVQIESCAS